VILSPTFAFPTILLLLLIATLEIVGLVLSIKTALLLEVVETLVPLLPTRSVKLILNATIVSTSLD
jgi:hypothetical protein